MIPAFISRWFVPAPDSGVADDIRRGKSPWTDSVHLMWSFWIFITPLFDGGLKGYTRTWLLFTLATYPVFVFLFAKIQLAPRRTIHFHAWGMAVLCFSVMRWYPSGLSYFVYACVMLGHCDLRHYRSHVAQVLALNVAYVGLGWWIGYPNVLLVIMPATVLVICTIVAVEQLNKQKDAALSLSHDEVRRLAATAERERIGRDLHDLLGHTLSLITLKLELSRKLFDRDVDAARREVEEAEKVARHALAEVRIAVSGIRAADLAAELASAQSVAGILAGASRLRSAANRFAAGHGARPVPGPARGSHQCRTARAASSAKVEFRREHACVRLLISDDGRGGIDGDGNGLRGMRERVRAIGGTLEIDSPRRGGTRLLVKAPVPVLRLVPSTPSTLQASGSTATSASGHSMA